MPKKRRNQKSTRSGTERTLSAVAWYAREDWEELKSVAVDSAALESTYEEWLTMATSAIANLETHGIRVERVEVSTDELKRWCAENKRPLDAAARAAFAAEKLRARYVGGK
jgi:hypothetical protein